VGFFRVNFHFFDNNFWVYLDVKTCEVLLCFVAFVRVRVYYVDIFVFFVLHHWRVLYVLTPRMSPISASNPQYFHYITLATWRVVPIT